MEFLFRGYINRSFEQAIRIKNQSVMIEKTAGGLFQHPAMIMTS